MSFPNSQQNTAGLRFSDTRLSCPALKRQISFVFPKLAAEQKARVTYDNILRLVDDPDVRDVIKFLREREIVHFQRFGDTKLAKRVDFQTEDNIFVQFYRPFKAKKKASEICF